MNDCQCLKCQHECERKPGWFAPGEVERVAEYLGENLIELFQKKLAVDFWVHTKDGLRETYILSPAITNRPPGGYFGMNPLGRCVFFKDGLCEIHPVKPLECRQAKACDPDLQVEVSHEGVMRLWDQPEHQAQILNLTGAPRPEPDVADLLGGFMEMIEDMSKERNG